MSRRTRPARLTTTLLAVPAALALAGCSSYSTGPDQVALEINGAVIGPADRYVEEDCIPAGTGDYADASSDFVYFPTSQRVYEFGPGDGVDGEAFTVAANGGVELTVTGNVTFYLNTDCETLREFYTDIAARYDATWDSNDSENPSGWYEILRIYIRTPLQRALDEATGEYTALQLHGDDAARSAWEDAVNELSLQYISESAGRDYFIDVSATINKPDLPDSPQAEINEGEAIAQDQRNQEARSAQLATEAEGIRQLIDLLGVDGYLAYRQNQLTEQQLDLLEAAVANGQVTILPVPQGTGLDLTQPTQ